MGLAKGNAFADGVQREQDEISKWSMVLSMWRKVSGDQRMRQLSCMLPDAASFAYMQHGDGPTMN